MAIDRYLAMTAAEIISAPSLPRYLGYMACHFSPYSTGLSNLPQALPPNAMLLLTDRTPISGHDPESIARQLSKAAERLHCRGILLDLQRPGNKETAELVSFLIDTISVPVGVAAHYAADLPCPILLPPVPLNIRLPDYLAPWQGREIWLEMAPDNLCAAVTPNGTSFSHSKYDPSPLSHRDNHLHCHYRTELMHDRVNFVLERTAADLESLLEEAEGLGVTLAIGLYQELGDIWI